MPVESGIQVTPGDADKAAQIAFFNRTGAATAVGDVVARDFVGTQAESDTPRNSRANVTPSATANLHLPSAVAQKVVADNDADLFVVAGPAKAKVNGVVAKGGLLARTNGQVYLSAAGAAAWAHGFALEANAAGTNVLEVYLFEHPIATPA
jgi:hypothetical protein